MQLQSSPRGLSRLIPWSGWALLALICGCQKVLPENARPQTLPSDARAFEAADKIRYRTLERDDFRGTALPSAFGDDPSQFSAASCITIQMSPDSRIVTRPQGPGEFEAKVEGIAFAAWLDRDCSWWNRFHQENLTQAYVLQHEQIHFAIHEVHARRLDAMADEIATRTAAVADSAEAAQAASQAKLDAFLRDAMAQLTRRNTRFDEDTSYGYDTQKQWAWHQQLHRELQKLAAH